MLRNSVIIDCDPGQDDAINLFLAFASPEEVEVRGLTTVAGNCALDLAQRNARIICEMCGRFDIPVFAGCDQPLLVRQMRAEHVHGKTGIDGIDAFDPIVPLQSTHASDYIIEQARHCASGTLTIVATAPMTNIAVALEKAPDIAQRIKRIVLMGGAMREGGNVTPSAEFNMRADPHAAQVVFSSGVPIVALGLDVTHMLMATAERLNFLSNFQNPIARATCDMLAFSERFDKAKYGSDGAPLHDPVTIAYLLRPELFETRQVSIQIETASALTLGHTAVDYWGITSNERNVSWATSVDAQGFFDLLFERLGRFKVK
jgi:purine nucleosidase